MITKLDISNFKSVRHLDINCKKINLFIGEPNTGKSNILEALALLSWCGHNPQPLSDYVRFELVQNLFYDGLVEKTVEIQMATTDISRTGLRVAFTGDSYALSALESPRPFRTLDEDAYCGETTTYGPMKGIRFFRFEDEARHDDKKPGHLKPPHGTNLFSVVSGSEILRETMVEFFRKYGLKLVMRRHERSFEIQKEVGGLVSVYPYALASDTLRRIIFYTVAMASNKDSVLVFEEPESNAFPYYTKYLGERIALDQTNQFFIATHNPYLLSAIVEKAPKQNIQVFVTYFKDYETRVKPLTSDQLSELMEADPFFNLDHFLGEDR